MTASARSIPSRTIGRNEGSAPTTVMSVPCSVTTSLGAVAEDLPREVGRDRVRDRVVHVQQLDAVGPHRVGHLRGERQRVRRVLEQRVGRDGHLVEGDAGRHAPEPVRQRVADEVHLVAAAGHREAELGGDRPGAAHRRIAGHADLHRPLPPVPGRGPRGPGSAGVPLIAPTRPSRHCPLPCRSSQASSSAGTGPSVANPSPSSTPIRFPRPGRAPRRRRGSSRSRGASPAPPPGRTAKRGRRAPRACARGARVTSIASAGCSSWRGPG